MLEQEWSNRIGIYRCFWCPKSWGANPCLLSPWRLRLERRSVMLLGLMGVQASLPRVLNPYLESTLWPHQFRDPCILLRSFDSRPCPQEVLVLFLLLRWLSPSIHPSTVAGHYGTRSLTSNGRAESQAPLVLRDHACSATLCLSCRRCAGIWPVPLQTFSRSARSRRL